MNQTRPHVNFTQPLAILACLILSLGLWGVLILTVWWMT